MPNLILALKELKSSIRWIWIFESKFQVFTTLTFLSILLITNFLLISNAVNRLYETSSIKTLIMLIFSFINYCLFRVRNNQLTELEMNQDYSINEPLLYNLKFKKNNQNIGFLVYFFATDIRFSMLLLLVAIFLNFIPTWTFLDSLIGLIFVIFSLKDSFFVLN